MENKIKVVELFAGVGGFRLGLEGWKGKSSSSSYKKALKSPFETEFTKLETSESYRDCGDLPLVGTFNCVVASMS